MLFRTSHCLMVLVVSLCLYRIYLNLNIFFGMLGIFSKVNYFFTKRLYIFSTLFNTNLEWCKMIDRVKKLSRTLNINLTQKDKKITAWKSWRVGMANCWRPMWVWKRAGLGPSEQEWMWRSEAFEGLEEYSWWWGMSGHLIILLSGGGVCWVLLPGSFLGTWTKPFIVSKVYKTKNEEHTQTTPIRWSAKIHVYLARGMEISLILLHWDFLLPKTTVMI